MRALTYHGNHDVRIETVDDPTIQHADDIIVRVTAAGICGADLHLYRGRGLPMKLGDIPGQEFIGEVAEVGADVTRVRKGERVVVPAVIACGECFFCKRNQHAACDVTAVSPKALRETDLRPGAALFGFGHAHGLVAGGHAEYVRVPRANVGPRSLPDTLSDEQAVFLGSSLAAAYQAVIQAGVGPGQSVAIFGAGPLGLLIAACARLLGAEQLLMVDHHAYRLAFARQHFDAIAINFDEVDAPEQAIIEHSPERRGADVVIDAVGFEARGSTLETVLNRIKFDPGSSIALRQCIAAVRRGGQVNITGAYWGATSNVALTEAFDKGVTLTMGQAHVHPYLDELVKHLEQGSLQPENIISHRMSLEEAAAGYLIFDKKQEECRKVILRP
ncbi:alcohol dehydrogenase catalytic domain-containing protein [Halopseudomonas nanhaiensis]|uniref:alcohol dehydrogenase catalytic domain-containing protein n=1 Tax=Halopseudomonas nanhaiensis TaxID=2830842 RepID=UPI001CBF315B|nr:alcohol dehydrogenase catalytic domain-containing protein [Halopseudomonas nanhaiensis]UAW97757.1 alcohol dehydrogenase catalytic domain-containing protein [Halopseudomonas nanhaiensis]